MLCIKKPSDDALARFLEGRIGEGFSYGPWASLEPRPGYSVDEEVTFLGHGRDVFRNACDSLRAWQHFALPWLTLYPAGATIAPGITVAVVVRYLGLWWLSACRIVRVTSEPDRWGFSYGTLWAHAESGEESFMIEIRPSDGLVTYELRAVARPRALVTRLGYPLTRALQARFRRDSGRAMKRAVRSGA